MAGAKEIRTKIRSIQNTQKITKAMEMVAASKMRKAQERMEEARPYAEKIRNVVSHLARAHPEYEHPFTVEREPRRVGYVVVSTDRGLCGGLNINLFRTALNDISQWHERGVEMDFTIIGSKAMGFFKRIRANIVSDASNLGDRPEVADLIGAIKVMLDAYDAGKIDRLFLLHNEFVTTMSQEPRVLQLLPLPPSDDEEVKHYWDYLYEPDPKDVLDVLMERYIESLVYQGVVENVACEMAARMIAMKAATDNAGNIIDDLQLAYNKARQAAITQEISEIVSGAAAV